MSNHRYTNLLLNSNSHPGRISQQQYFSQLRADNEMLTFWNGNPGAYRSLHDISHTMSADSGHLSTGPLQIQPELAHVSIFQNNKIFLLT